MIAAAVFQASWNFFAKKSKADKTSVLAVGWLFLGLVVAFSLPWAVDFTGYNSNWIYFCLASGVIHAVYVALLGWGYSVGDISIVYPIARGLGILWTAIISFAFGLQNFSFLGTLGVFAILFGVLLIGLKAIQSPQQKKGFFIGIAVSLTISAYSLVDGAGAKQVPLALYIAMMNLITATIVLPFLFRFNPPKVREVFRAHKLEAFLIAVGGSLSYVIILWAFQRSPVAYIASLREVSVVIASLLGFFVLKEEFSKRKIIGILLVVLGAVFLKWS